MCNANSRHNHYKTKEKETTFFSQNNKKNKTNNESQRMIIKCLWSPAFPPLNEVRTTGFFLCFKACNRLRVSPLVYFPAVVDYVD